METKHPLASKTVWLQIVTVLSLLVPAVREWLVANPVEFVSVLAAANVIVRFVTRGKVSVFSADSENGEKTAGGGSGGLPLLIVGTAAAGVCFTALPSCSALKEMPMRLTAEVDAGRVSYSSKAGLEVAYRPQIERKSAK